MDYSDLRAKAVKVLKSATHPAATIGHCVYFVAVVFEGHGVIVYIAGFLAITTLSGVFAREDH